MQIDPRTGSHPGVRFDNHPAVQGELYQLSKPEARESLIQEVVERTAQDFKNADSRLLLEETLYQERQRLKRSKTFFLTSMYISARNKRDREFIQNTQAGLKQAVGEEEQKRWVKKYAEHFGKEICGSFEPKMYDFAIFMVPWFFSWLLNAASLKRFIPWGMVETLQSRLRVVGEVNHLQKLSKSGTILMVPTHLSNIDSFLIGYVIHLMNLPPFAYGAGLNLFSNPVLAFSMNRLGAYSVDRQKVSVLYKAALKNYSISILKRGIHSIFFPGGGRSRTGAVESHLKLGLLGTAVQAQIERLKENHPSPNIYVVPVVMSYHFVFEGSSLIEDYLEQSGKHRFVPNDSQEEFPFVNTLKFFWKLFSSRSEIWINVGKPLDVFGNFVDQEGRSLGPNGTVIDPRQWLMTEGELQTSAQRDREYTLILGNKISERFHAENIVLSSHLVAFTLFQTLRKQYPHLDLFRFLRISEAQRAVPLDKFYQEAEKAFAQVQEAAHQNRLILSDPLRCGDIKLWVEDGVRQLGLFHAHKVAKIQANVITSDDMNLLYFYRNRLSGYGFGRLERLENSKIDKIGEFFGEKDEQGFLV